jgi:hypothetical protein
VIDDSAIHAIVERLARPTGAGGHAIERAAILAEGSDFADIEAWIVRKGGEPQSAAAGARGTGLHAERIHDARSLRAETVPTRYLLPAETFG